MSRSKPAGWSALKTLFIVLFSCIMTVTVLHLSYFDTWVQHKLLRDPNQARDRLLTIMSDHSLVVLNELIDMEVDFTLFAPTKKSLGIKLENATSCDLAEFFEGHIVYERIISTSVAEGGSSFESAKGTKLLLEVKDMAMTVQGVPVLYDNIVVGPRGIIHVIEGLLEEVVIASRPEPGSAQAGEGEGEGGGGVGVGVESPKGGEEPKNRKPKRKPNPFDVVNLKKEKNINICSGHGFVGPEGECVCASLYTGKDCSEVVQVSSLEGIVGYSPIVFNKKEFQTLNEIMVRTEAKTLSMIPKVTPDVRKSIMEVLPEDDPFHGRVFNVCSLVGSSGSLLYFENGPAIDESDLVIRFNHAPIKMFEKFVGSRTDLRISNGEHLGFNEKPNEKTLHHLRAKSFLTRILLYEKKFGKAKLPYLVNPGFTEYVANASLPYIASSGYFAILMAMEVCSHVHLYGFHSSFNQGSRHHYFNAEVPSNPKRDTSEYERLKHLEDLGFLKFAEPCLHECYGSSSDCEACFGEPMYKVTAKQKLSRAQIKLAEDLEKERVKFRQWEGPLKRQWEFSDKEGLIKKTGDSRRRRRRGRRSGGRSRGGRRNRRSGGRSRGHSTNMSVNIHLATERARAAVGATQKPES